MQQSPRTDDFDRSAPVEEIDPEVLSLVLKLISVLADGITLLEAASRLPSLGSSGRLPKAIATAQDVIPHINADLRIVIGVVRTADDIPFLEFGEALLLNRIAKDRYDTAVENVIDQMKRLHRSLKTIQNAATDSYPRHERFEAVREDIRLSRSKLSSIRRSGTSVQDALEILEDVAMTVERVLNEVAAILQIPEDDYY